MEFHLFLQRVNIEKSRHRTIVTSDVGQQIMLMNRKVREEWEKKQAEAEKLQVANEVSYSCFCLVVNSSNFFLSVFIYKVSNFDDLYISRRVILEMMVIRRRMQVA